MAKKTKEELIEEGKALALDIQAIRTKGPLNFAVFLGDDGVVALFDKVRKPEALRIDAKKAGATPKGAVGTATCEGKVILLTCAEGEAPPPKLGKAFKRHLKDRGLSFKVRIADVTGKVIEDDEDDEAPPPKDGQAKDSTAPEPATGIKEKLEKAFDKVKAVLVETLKAAPSDYQPKLRTPALAYTDAMKAEDYETAMKALTALRQALMEAPTAERLTGRLADKGDPAKLAEMEGLLDNIRQRAKAEKDFDKTAKPLMKELRGALKTALAARPPPDDKVLAKLARMKKALDQTFLDYLKQEGHGPQRHEGDVTTAQLTARAVERKDPMTGTTTDGVHGGTHKVGRHATRIKDAGDYVDAEDTVRGSQAFADSRKDAASKGETRFSVELPLKDVLGDDYKDKLEGVGRLGSIKHPTGSAPTDFTDGTLTAVYDVAADGTVTLVTLYPNPKSDT